MNVNKNCLYLTCALDCVGIYRHKYSHSQGTCSWKLLLLPSSQRVSGERWEEWGFVHLLPSEGVFSMLVFAGVLVEIILPELKNHYIFCSSFLSR